MSDYGFSRVLTLSTVFAIGLGTYALSRLLGGPSTTTTPAFPTGDTTTTTTRTSIISDGAMPDIVQLMLTQDQTDSEYGQFVPNLHQKNISWPGGTLNFDEVTYHGYESVIFTVIESENLLVKLKADCDELGWTIHPLLREFWFGSDAYNSGIGPKMLFLSPPVPLEGAYITQSFEMSSERFETCVRNGGTVRFLVMNRISEMVDLHVLRQRYPLRKVPLDFAVTILTNIISELRRLHLHAQVVHGDIHPGNILVDSRGNVQIIDYGRAKRNTRAMDENRMKQKWFHQAFSHWQLQGYEWSMRDDVFNALRVFSIMINSEEYELFESRVARDPSKLLDWKSHGFIFSIPREDQNSMNSLMFKDPLKSFTTDETTRYTIRSILGRVLSSVRSLHSVNSVPHYESMLIDLNDCFRTLIKK